MVKIKDETKVKVGIILLVIGTIFLPIIPISIMTLVLLPIPVIFIPVGFIVLYRGLSIRNRRIMLLIIGGIFIAFSTFVINTALLAYTYSRITLMVVNIIFWSLCFIIPGAAKLIKGIEFDETTVYLYALAPTTFFWLFIYTIVIVAITSEAPSTFTSLYSHYFLIALGGGFLISLIIIGFVYLEEH
ncbi:MAG: hypothetical protein ACFFCV_01725 [Promethearchaeota archaeon]